MARANTLIVLAPRENITIALQELSVGMRIELEDLAGALEVITPIPRGHKIALDAIDKGTLIKKYGVRMGHAYAPIARESHVHTPNVIGDRVSTEPEATP
jgi:hypothetical protein